MNATQEKKYLKCVLKQFQLEKPGFYCGRVAEIVLWIVGITVVFVLFRMGHGLPLWVILAVSMFLGVLVGIFSFYKVAAERWPFLRPHVSRESIEARIAELEP
jgi:hypothetical protein